MAAPYIFTATMLEPLEYISRAGLDADNRNARNASPLNPVLDFAITAASEVLAIGIHCAPVPAKAKADSTAAVARVR